MVNAFQSYLDEERRRRRIALGLPPDLPAPLPPGMTAAGAERVARLEETIGRPGETPATRPDRPIAGPFQIPSVPIRAVQEAVETGLGAIGVLGARFLPGQQQLEEEFREAQAEGSDLPTAAFKAWQRSDFPSTTVEVLRPALAALPFPGPILAAFAPQLGIPRVEMPVGAKGAAELAGWTVLPGGGLPARAIGRAAERGVTSGVGALRVPAAEAAARAGAPKVGLRILGKPQVAGAAGKTVVGRETVAYGPDPNKSYRMRYRIAEMDDLIPSHTDAFAPNPAYPQELQPRMREKGANRLAVEKMARDLVPEAIVQDSQALDRGPMIVGADNVVESGNGRLLALRKAQQSYPERWQAYQQTLRDALPQFGVNEQEIAQMRNPVLVRERVSDVDRVRFAAEANQPAVAVFSPLENALQDSKRIRLDALVVPEETQALDTTLRTASNRPFITSFLETLPENERSSLVDAMGELNLLGMARIKAAMFARTYPGPAGRRLTQIFFESREPLIRNVEEGMMASLPKVAKAEDLVRSGQRAADLSIGEDLAAALDMLARLRVRKISAEQYLAQRQMFERELTPFQEHLLGTLEPLARSPRKVREFLGDYADRVVASPHPQQAAMLAGGERTKEGLFNATIRAQSEGPLFAAPEAGAPARAAEAPGKGLVAETQRVSKAQIAAAKPTAAKEPWQMIRGEFADSVAPTRRTVGMRREDAGNLHRESVRLALSEGKPVPAEVLADYPDLAAGAGKAAEALPDTRMVTPTVRPPAVQAPTAPDEVTEVMASARAALAAAETPAEEAAVRARVIPKVLAAMERTLRPAAAKPGAAKAPALVRETRPVSVPAEKPSLAAPPPPPTAAAGPAQIPPRLVTPPTTVPPAAAAEAPRTPVEATNRIKAIQQTGQRAPESVPASQAKEAHVELGTPDGPRPPKPPRPTRKGAPPPDEPTDILGQITDKATRGERPDQTLLRLHEAAISSETRRVGVIIRDGNAKLKALGIGVYRRGHLVPKEQDIPKLDALNNALHNPSWVEAGELQVPQGFKAIYQELRDRADWTQAAMLDFDPNAATILDYFYRGWKPPAGAFIGEVQGRPLIRTPAFKKPRVNATYQEMREAGFEPLFWNPYQQWGVREMMGTKYREQMELVRYLKGMGDELIRPDTGGATPPGWRIPRVGPAFEGKPFATVDAAGKPTVMYTRRWIALDKVANALENAYGVRPDIGKLVMGGKSIDPLSVIDVLTFLPKRAKLFGSLFQQFDFLNRAGAGSWSMAVDSLFSGKPGKAVIALAKYPQTVATIIRANVSPSFRQTLAKQLDSIVPLLEGRPGVHLKGISEAGLSTYDPAMFRWEDMDKAIRVVAAETGVKGMALKLYHAIGDAESAMRRGLFSGVYPAAMITDIRNNIAPMLARMYPELNDAQLMGTIAHVTNKQYSSIPASQSVIQNRFMRETLRRIVFSLGESEGLLRQATGAIRGPEAIYWRTHWLGVYLFVISVASAIHFASTGKPLPKERFIPVSKDKWGPLPFGYNTQFAAPTIPLKGRGGAELTLDIVGQMDTALRVLNPGFFISARLSVPARAGINQVSGTDFFGRPIDDVGPGGVVSRTAQLAQDLFTPIGAGSLLTELGRRTIPGGEEVLQEVEARLGLPGLGVQATGMNVRAATREMRLRSIHGPAAQATLEGLDRLGLDLGYVTRNFDMVLGKKGGEITLTPEQREQLQWLTDDAIVLSLSSRFASAAFLGMTDEQKKEAVQAQITKARALARAKFRAGLRQQVVSTQAPMRPSAPTPAPAPAISPARLDELLKKYRIPTPVPAGAR